MIVINSGVKLLIFFFFISNLIVVSKSWESDYTDLIIKFIFKQSVQIVNIFSYDSFIDLQASTALSAMLKSLSRHHIFSIVTRTSDVPKQVAYYRKKISKPLFVVFVNSMSDFTEFSSLTSAINVNSYKILLIFTKYVEICENPRGNPLNLVFSSNIMVKCYNSQVIYEWYSLRPHQTESFRFLEWDPEHGELKILSSPNLYERRNSLHGVTLKVAGFRRNSAESTIFGDILYELSTRTDFKVDNNYLETAVGIFVGRSNRSLGVIEKLVAKKADLGILDFGVTLSRRRLDTIDFSRPVILTNSNFYLKKTHTSHLQSSMYRKALGLKAFYCLLAIFLVSPIILTATMSRKSGLNIYDNYFNVWSIICGKALPVSPAQSSSQIVLVSLHIVFLVLYAVYSTLLVSWLTVFEPDMPFNNLDEFLAVKTHKVTAVKGTYLMETLMFSNETSIKNVKNYLVNENELPLSFPEANNAVCDANNLVLYEEDVRLQMFGHNHKCELIPFERGRLNNNCIVLAKNSAYTGLINFYLEKMRTAGLTDAIKKRYSDSHVLKDHNHRAVSFRSVLPVLKVLGWGVMISVSVLICEYVVFYSNVPRSFVVKPVISDKTHRP